MTSVNPRFLYSLCWVFPIRLFPIQSNWKRWEQRGWKRDEIVKNLVYEEEEALKNKEGEVLKKSEKYCDANSMEMKCKLDQTFSLNAEYTSTFLWFASDAEFSHISEK